MSNTKERGRMRTSPFNHIGVLNSVNEAPVIYSHSHEVEQMKKLEFSPYVNYIPVQYLCYRPSYFDDEMYINCTDPITICSSRYNNLSHFHEIGQPLLKTGRTIVKSIGSYGLTYNEEPHIIACILPENIVYQKLHILSRDTMDLSKVIIFINKELDDVEFQPRSIRTLYRTELLPKIVQTSATVFKVPLQFIMDNCFHRQNILPCNIEERRKFKKKMLEDLKNSVKKPGLSHDLASESYTVTNMGIGYNSFPTVTGSSTVIGYETIDSTNVLVQGDRTI